MVAIHRTAKPNKQGLIGTFPKTEPMQEVSVLLLNPEFSVGCNLLVYYVLNRL